MNQDRIDEILTSGSLSTYDPYDVWKTKVGVFTKKLFFHNRFLGMIPAAWLTFYDTFMNNRWRAGYKKQEYPVVRAQAALALLHLYKKKGLLIYLSAAERHLSWLKKHRSHGYSGLCWGTGFKIVIDKDIVYNENTPFVTNTPYVLEAFDMYYKITGDKEAKTAILDIYIFFEKDVYVFEENDEILITSYGPFKDRIVTNAISYTMLSYAIFSQYVENNSIALGKVQKLFNFIIQHQRNDGSWMYAPLSPNSFIDCFHSCFVLKNIIKTSRLVELDRAESTLKRGYYFLLENMEDNKTGLFKRFHVQNKPGIVKFDLYDNAEMLLIAKLLNDRATYRKLEAAIQKNFENSNDVYNYIDLFGFRRNKNTYRWATMPYILAICTS